MATKDDSRTTTQNEVAKDANKRSVSREKHPIEAMPNELGEVADIDTSKFPDDSAAHEGQATPPSGQGGASPKSRPDYQDQFPANPPPSDNAREWGEKIRDVGAVEAHSQAIAEAAKASAPKDK